MIVPEVDSRGRILIAELTPRQRYQVRESGAKLVLLPTEESPSAAADDRRRIKVPAAPGSLFRAVVRPKGIVLIPVHVVDLDA